MRMKRIKHRIKDETESESEEEPDPTQEEKDKEGELAKALRGILEGSNEGRTFPSRTGSR